MISQSQQPRRAEMISQSQQLSLCDGHVQRLNHDGLGRHFVHPLDSYKLKGKDETWSTICVDIGLGDGVGDGDDDVSLGHPRLPGADDRSVRDADSEDGGDPDGHCDGDDLGLFFDFMESDPCGQSGQDKCADDLPDKDDLGLFFDFMESDPSGQSGQDQKNCPKILRHFVESVDK